MQTRKQNKKLMCVCVCGLCVSVCPHFTTIPFLASGSGRLLILVPWLFRTSFFLSACMCSMSDGWGGGELRRCRTECHNHSALCVIQKMVGWAGLGWAGGECACAIESHLLSSSRWGKRATFPSLNSCCLIVTRMFEIFILLFINYFIFFFKWISEGV